MPGFTRASVPRRRSDNAFTRANYPNELRDFIKDSLLFKMGTNNDTGISPWMVPQLCYVKNNTGYPLAIFNVLGIDATPMHDPADPNRLQQFLEGPTFVGVTPDVAIHAGKFLVMAESVEPQGYGLAYVSGTFVTKINVTESIDTFADVQNNTIELKSGTAGAAQILWKESGTGAGKYAIVRIGGSGNSAAALLDVIILSYAQDDANMRWIYTVAEDRQTAYGYGHREVIDAEDSFEAFNEMEEINGATGMFGIGVASDELGDCVLKPIAVGTPIKVWPKRVIGETDPAYWFSVPNSTGPEEA